MAVARVAVKTNPLVDNRRVSERGKCRRQELAQIFFFLQSNCALGRFRRHFPPRPVICDFHDALAAKRKAIIARCRNIRAENRKTLRCKKLRLDRLEMKNRLPGCAKKFPREGQNVRRPCADCHYDQVAPDSLSVIEENTLHTSIAFIQTGELAAFARFDAERFCPLDEQRDHTSTLNVASLSLENAVGITFRVPCRKVFTQGRSIDALNFAAALLQHS